MANVDWGSVYLNSDDWFQSFMVKVKEIYEASFPLVRLSRRRSHDRPWVTTELKEKIKKNHKLYKSSIRTPSSDNYIRYKEHNLTLKRCLKDAETSYYNTIFDNKKNSSGNMWKSLGPIINPGKFRKQTGICKILEQGVRISDKNIIPDILNDHFCNVGERLQSKLPPHNPDEFKQYLPQPIVNSFYLSYVSYREVLNQITKLNPKKAAGHDNIGSKIILLCPEIFARNLTIIFNQSIRLGLYPDSLKLGKVIALFKKGDKAPADNYRPISLLSTCNKIFEKLICRQLLKFLEIK